MSSKKQSMIVQGVEIHVMTRNEDDYISLTDMVSGFEDGSSLIQAWMRNKDTVEFLGVWERINNPDFNYPEFEVIRNQAGLNRFTLSIKTWVERVKGIGVFAKAGRYGGTFAHRDIAFEFGSWLSPEFKLYLIKEFQRLKEKEIQENNLEWNVRRLLVKTNYKIHTDAIKANLIPPEVSKQQEAYIYASEADLLNIALFGMTAKEWRNKNPDKKGNIRDSATVEQLVVLANLESQNALLIQQNKDKYERLSILNKLAIFQINSLVGNEQIKMMHY